MSTSDRRRLAAALACGATLVLASCGGGDDDDSSGDLAELLDDAGNGDLSDLDESDLQDLLGDLADGDLGSLGDLGEDADLGDLFGEDGALAGLDEVFGDGGLEEFIEEQSGVDIQVGDDGFSFESEDGSFSIDEDGNFTVTDDQGNETTGDVGADGDGFSVESDDGSMNVATTDELPDDWPGDVPTPDGLDIESVASIDADGSVSFTVMGSVDGDHVAWIEDYGAQLEAAGFERNTFIETGDDVSGFYQRDPYDLYVNSASFGSTTISVTLTSTG